MTLSNGTGSARDPKSMPLKVAGQPRDWAFYRDHVADFVPDPMILRAGDVFLMGQERASSDLPHQKDGHGSQIWQALDRNIHGILCFFDLLVTRERIPLIDYRHTYRTNVFDKELAGRTVRVDVDHEHYETVKAGALANLRRCKTSALSAGAVEDVSDELAAFGWDWSPDLAGVKVSDKRRPVAQFLLGGFLFGAYAQATGTEHLLQSKRSRLFLALSAPGAGQRAWAYEREQALFERLREACKADGSVRYEELPAAPSVVPYLMARNPRVDSPQALLGEVMTFRDSPDGETYRRWWQDLRAGLAKGQVAAKARHDIDQVAAELDRRFGTGDAKASQARVSFELGIEAKVGLPVVAEAKATAKAKVENVTLPKVEWLRRFIVERTTLRKGHSRVLLRLSVASKEHENLVLGMERLWRSRARQVSRPNRESDLVE